MSKYKTKEYAQLQQNIASGWNTWDTDNTFSFVKLPKGLSLTIGLKYTGISEKQYLPKGYPSLKFESDGTQIKPLAHYENGKYTCQEVQWNEVILRIESASVNSELILLITPKKLPKATIYLYLEGGYLWNKPGTVVKNNDVLVANSVNSETLVYSTDKCNNVKLAIRTPYLCFELKSAIGFCTNNELSIDEIKKQIEIQKSAYYTKLESHGDLKEVFEPMTNVLGWNTIYDPTIKRVITPVSRVWNSFFSSYVLFCWDTFFAAFMYSSFSKEMAYANAIEIIKSKTTGGFVPNYRTAYNCSYDRSQPPVGSLIIKEIYQKYKDIWFLNEVFDDLLEWNDWWVSKRNNDRFLCWGSDETKHENSDLAENTHLGAMYECGLDNSPMYTDVHFNKKTHLLELADVGLMSLYITDCRALMFLANELGKSVEAVKLFERAEYFSRSLKKLWNEKKGTFLNYRTDTKKFSEIISPTNLYPLLAGVPTQEQAEIMMEKCYFNSNIFYGDYVLPSIARENPEFEQQDYWKGRIWAPMNMLVYLGLRNYNLTDAKLDLAQKSKKMMLNNLSDSMCIFENYRASGIGRDENEQMNNSDSFYHWGALLGFISILESEQN